MTHVTTTAKLAHIGIATQFAESAVTNLRQAAPRWLLRSDADRLKRLEAAYGDVEMARVHADGAANAAFSTASKDIVEAMRYLREGDSLSGLKTSDALGDVREGIAQLHVDSVRLRTAANVERASRVAREVMQELEGEGLLRISAGATDGAAANALARRAISAAVD